jgi:hypothetical protein
MGYYRSIGAPGPTATGAQTAPKSTRKAGAERHNFSCRQWSTTVESGVL